MGYGIYPNSIVRFEITESGRAEALRNLSTKKKILISLSQASSLEESMEYEKDLKYLYNIENVILNSNIVSLKFADYIDIFGTINSVIVKDGKLEVL